MIYGNPKSQVSYAWPDLYQRVPPVRFELTLDGF